MGHLASINFGVNIATEHMGLEFFGYNDEGLTRFIKEVLKSVQNFDISQ